MKNGKNASLLEALNKSMNKTEEEWKKHIAELHKEEEYKDSISVSTLPKIILDLKKFQVIDQASISYNPEKYSFTKDDFNVTVNRLFDAEVASWTDNGSFPYGEMLFKYDDDYYKICLLIGQGSNFTIKTLGEEDF